MRHFSYHRPRFLWMFVFRIFVSLVCVGVAGVHYRVIYPHSIVPFAPFFSVFPFLSCRVVLLPALCPSLNRNASFFKYSSHVIRPHFTVSHFPVFSSHRILLLFILLLVLCFMFIPSFLFVFLRHRLVLLFILLPVLCSPFCPSFLFSYFISIPS